ncbi:inositol monophosphatase family protein [Staphylococcus massiliensis]|uniref:Inositol monophosphatase family protein n=1 Tax=Staphylococcus massiliensis S46 TaxID=1229783 RepID=K9AYT2_9STAP|nr:inositol monophosphatase family protein [Staphylococcus massiliensis]EKU47712.1 inositol monophosphatase family protein [Staphylococcus massiliensis S46]MCG3400491.1 inositol monophosphatase family protein [Staphylococcus massiliensis]MCG3401477.1 inositol monophosphatase family protein [Staphylococcus massiliensis]POA01286.1 inositol monophosphatase family protein [Staphylococcus massiliensis CCUG 55927]
MLLYDFAKTIILEAGNNIRTWMNEDIDIETKSNPNDLVTNVDKETEQFLVQKIHDHDPSHLIVGEEGHGHDLTNVEGTIWVIDPIDGTLNFVHQKENFAISVGIFVDGEMYAGFVYDVMKDRLYHAKSGDGAYVNDRKLPILEDASVGRNLIAVNPNWLTKPKLSQLFHPIVNQSRSARAYGSAALEIVYVATGQLSLYMTPRLKPWDFAGGWIILKEVQGKITNLNGDDISILEPSSILAGNHLAHHEALSYFKANHQDVLDAIHS